MAVRQLDAAEALGFIQGAGGGVALEHPQVEALGPVAHDMGEQRHANAFAVVGRVYIKLFKPCVRIGGNTGDDAIGFCHDYIALRQHLVCDEPQILFRRVDHGHAGHGSAGGREGAGNGDCVFWDCGSDGDCCHGVICRNPVSWVKLTPMGEKPDIDIVVMDDTTREAAHELMRAQWGDRVVSLGRVVDPFDIPARVAMSGGVFAGVAAYLIEADELEVVALASTGAVSGVGRALMDEMVSVARQAGLRRVRLITTNDNLQAIGFYQIIGMTIARVGVNAMEEARKLKPEIPLTGNQGIPIRDEIEFEYLIEG